MPSNPYITQMSCNQCGLKLNAAFMFGSGICMDCASQQIEEAQRVHKQNEEAKIKAAEERLNKRQSKVGKREDTTKLKKDFEQLTKYIMEKLGLPEKASHETLDELMLRPGAVWPAPEEEKKPEYKRTGPLEVGTRVKLAPEFFYYATSAPTSFVDKVVNRFGFRARDVFKIAGTIVTIDGQTEVHIENEQGQWIKGLAPEDLLWVK